MDSMSISKVMGMESMNMAFRMLPDVNSVSLPEMAIQKY
jgi:hypothetical protein